MCDPGEKEKAKITIKDQLTEMPPTMCADTMQTALNGSDSVNPNIIARGLRSLCRWMSRVYQCINDRMTKLEENTPNNARIEILDCRDKQLEAGLATLEKKFKAMKRLLNTGIIAREKLKYRFDTHVRGGTNTPLETLRGQEKLLRRGHPHDPGGHVTLTEDQSQRLTSGKATHEEILEEIEMTEKAQAAMDTTLNSQVMRDTCPDVPMGLEAPGLQFCHRCGVKL
jgi:hypothetical protein